MTPFITVPLRPPKLCVLSCVSFILLCFPQLRMRLHHPQGRPVFQDSAATRRHTHLKKSACPRTLSTISTSLPSIRLYYTSQCKLIVFPFIYVSILYMPALQKTESKFDLEPTNTSRTAANISDEIC